MTASYGQGDGGSKKEAEQAAAAATWQSLSERAASGCRNFLRSRRSAGDWRRYVHRSSALSDVEVFHPRAIRRHVPGAADFSPSCEAARLREPERRGKYMWFPLEDGRRGHRAPWDERSVQGSQGFVGGRAHLRVLVTVETDGGFEFVDQRTFGGLWS